MDVKGRWYLHVIVRVHSVRNKGDNYENRWNFVYTNRTFLVLSCFDFTVPAYQHKYNHYHTLS